MTHSFSTWNIHPSFQYSFKIIWAIPLILLHTIMNTLIMTLSPWSLLSLSSLSPRHHQKRLRLLPMKRGIPFVLSQLLADTEHSKQYQRHRHHCHHQHHLPDCSHHQGGQKRLRLVTTRWHRPLPTEKRRAGKRQKSRAIMMMMMMRRISTMAKRRRMMTT